MPLSIQRTSLWVDVPSARPSARRLDLLSFLFTTSPEARARWIETRNARVCVFFPQTLLTSFCDTGGYAFGDFLKFGLPLQLVCMLATVPACHLLYR